MGNIPDYPAPGRPLADEDQFAAWVDGKQVAVSVSAIKKLTLDDPSFVAVAEDLLLGDDSAVRKTAGAVDAITEAAEHIPAIEAAPAAAEIAEAARDEAREWAEGTGEPGSAGSRSAKSWAAILGITATYTTEIDSPIYAATIQATNGALALGIDPDGTIEVDGITPRKIAGLPTRGYVTRNTSFYQPALHFIPFQGQSKDEGASGGGRFNTTNPYGMRAFAKRSNPTTTDYPLIATGTEINGTFANSAGGQSLVKEGPMHGLRYAGELAEKRDGVILNQALIQIFTACNGLGGTPLSYSAPGGTGGQAALAQVNRAKARAVELGLPFICEALHISQGEAGSNGNASGLTYPVYKADYKACANDFDGAIRAITGGTRPVNMLFTQTNTPTGGGAPIASEDFPVARAQLDSYLDGDSRAVLVTPEYMVGTFTDALHYPSREAIYLGGYHALAYTRIAIEKVGWTPLTFQVAFVIGNYVYLKAIGAEGPLVIDTTQVPAQDDPTQGMFKGLTCRNTSDFSIVNVTSVDVAGGYLRVGLAASPYGKTIRLAINRAVNRGPFVGGCANIRDSLGDILPMFEGNGIWRKMHKWPAAQQWSIS